MKSKYIFTPSNEQARPRTASSVEALNLTFWERYDLQHNRATLYELREDRKFQIKDSALKNYKLHIYNEEP
jgi:hypothetical protein